MIIRQGHQRHAPVASIRCPRPLAEGLMLARLIASNLPPPPAASSAAEAELSPSNPEVN